MKKRRLSFDRFEKINKDHGKRMIKIKNYEKRLLHSLLPNIYMYINPSLLQNENN